MVQKTSILLVDDDPRIIRFVRANLESVGYKVLAAGEVRTALQLLTSETPDLIILDIMLPEMDGYEFCQQVRGFSNIPIIMLTAKAEEVDKVKGLRLGADDYLTKPFGVQELLARIEAVLRRSKGPEEDRTRPAFTCGELSIDFACRRIVVRQREVSLTPTEYKLLCLLVNNAGRVMLHEELLTRVWGPEYLDAAEYLRAYIRHLRVKIEENPQDPKYIVSKPGVGYMFVSSS